MTAWAPPEGWVQDTSALDGVSVWRPAPEAPAQADAARAFPCPRCGAPTAWDPAAGALACAFCDHRAEVASERPAEVGEFTAEALSAAPRGWGETRTSLHCASCGADVAMPEGHVAARCPFCASAQVDFRQVADDALRPQKALGFRIPAAETARLAAAWLGRGWMHPSDLARTARVDAFTGIYLPWWLFDATLDCAYECERGDDETVVTYDSQGRRETRTVTRWRWVSGHIRPHWRNCPVSGTTRVPGVERVERFPHDEAVPYTPELLAGFAAQTYDVSLPDAWERGRSKLRALAAEQCKRDAGGDHQRNLSMTADLSDEAWTYALLPVWVSAYQFGGKTWVVLVNGATGEVGGQRPVAWWKVYLAMVAALTPGVFTGVCIGLPGLFFAGIGVIALFFALVFLILGGAGAVGVYQAAIAEETL